MWHCRLQRLHSMQITADIPNFSLRVTNFPLPVHWCSHILRVASYLGIKKCALRFRQTSQNHLCSMCIHLTFAGNGSLHYCQRTTFALRQKTNNKHSRPRLYNKPVHGWIRVRPEVPVLSYLSLMQMDGWRVETKHIKACLLNHGNRQERIRLPLSNKSNIVKMLIFSGPGNWRCFFTKCENAE